VWLLSHKFRIFYKHHILYSLRIANDLFNKERREKFGRQVSEYEDLEEINIEFFILFFRKF